MTKIQILGTGCSACDRLRANAEQAAREAGVAWEIEKVTDILKIIEFGALALPALAINGEVRAAGRVLSPAEIKGLLARPCGEGVP